MRPTSGQADRPRRRRKLVNFWFLHFEQNDNWKYIGLPLSHSVRLQYSSIVIGKRLIRTMTHRQVQYACIIILIGMALVLVTHLVRPGLSAVHSSWIVFIFGVLPNFGAALSLPFMMIVLATRFLQLGGCKLINCFVICLGVTFFGLAAWEVIQTLVWGYPIDPNDIAATGLGVVFAISVYMLFLQTVNSANKS
jgi:hypothetical protein